MLASILEAAGLRTGLYTSPHLVRINERIRIDGDEICDADFAATFTRIHAAIEELLASGALAAHPTYFECVTAMAFDYFARQKVDIAVIEVGLGGRLDSTNIIAPEVAVITKIDFDHENFLGHSIEQIAAEKAGIIKPGAWVVSNAGNASRRRSHPPPRRRAKRPPPRSRTRTSPRHPPGRLLRSPTGCRRGTDGCYRFTAAANKRLANRNRPAPRRTLPDPKRPHRHRRRAPAGRTRLPHHRRRHRRGLAAVRWPGRIERLQDRPAVYLDGTHNPAGARELAAFWEEQFPGRRIHLIYGAMRDKAVDEVAGLLFPRAATVILTQSPQPRSISAETLASLTRHLAPNLEVIPDPAAALERALSRAAPDDIVFATGSLYLVGDLLRYWSTHCSGTTSVSSTVGR